MILLITRFAKCQVLKCHLIVWINITLQNNLRNMPDISSETFFHNNNVTAHAISHCQNRHQETKPCKSNAQCQASIMLQSICDQSSHDQDNSIHKKYGTE